jgi:hypothetical protein
LRPTFALSEDVVSLSERWLLLRKDLNYFNLKEERGEAEGTEKSGWGINVVE